MPTKLITINETPQATFEKRFFASHYSYRDYYAVATGADPTAALASYIFGTAARAVSSDNWPRAANNTTTPPVAGDGRITGEPEAQNTYARVVTVLCNEDVFIIIHSINPRWTRLYIKYLIIGLSASDAISRISSEGVALTITEVPTFIPANTLMTFNPTLGYAITFYQSTASGTIRIWAEGNQEGLE